MPHGVDITHSGKSLIPLFLGLLLALSACSTSSTKSTAKSPSNPLFSEDVASALLTDEVLAKQLEIQDQTFVRGTDKVALAQGFLLNKTGQPLKVEIRTLFKNSAGETLETSPWKKLTLPPKIRVGQAAPTINRFVTRYLLEIRKAP